MISLWESCLSFLQFLSLCFQSYPSPSETPHEALMDKLQKTETCELRYSLYRWSEKVHLIIGCVNKDFLPSFTASKRGSADEASKLRDIVLKPKELSQPQK